jgi:hypothetical protein
LKKTHVCGYRVLSPMLKLLLSAVAVLFLLGLTARADANAGPLVVAPQSPDWTVKYKKDSSGDTYTLVPPTAQTADFAFSRWAIAGNSDQIPGYLHSVARGFVQKAQINPRIQLASYDYDEGEFIGDPYSGKYVAFTFKNGLKDYLFIFGDNTGLWSGHFIGTPDGWLSAMEVLKGIQKSADAGVAKP